MIRQFASCLTLILAFAACAMADLIPGTHDLSVQLDGTTRPYLLHVPPADDDKPMPLVMMLHGAGGSAAGTSRHYGWVELADQQHFAVVFPQAMPANPDRPVSFALNPRAWRDFSGRLTPLKRADDISYLAAVLDDVQRQLPIDAKRVYITGFSSGASMTFKAAALMSDRFAAAAPVSGHCWKTDIKLKRAVPLLFTVGDSDPLNPLNGGPGRNPWGDPSSKPPYQQDIDAWRTAINAPKDPKSSITTDTGFIVTTYIGDHGCTLRYVIVPSLGHEWPGHPRVLPKSMTGPNVLSYDLTAKIWQFFKDHPLPDSQKSR